MLSLGGGHDAWSCDILPAESPSDRHIVGNALDLLDEDWNVLIAHPPCTRLTNSGVRWLSEPPTQLDDNGYTAQEVADYALMGREERLAFIWHKLDEGAALFSAFLNCRIPRKCIENPVMHRYAKQRIARYRRPSQSVQPWMFGHPESKRTCFWLENLEPLDPVYRRWEDCRRALGLPVDAEPEQRIFLMPKSKDRWKERSRFFPGIAAAMAERWGKPPRQTSLFEMAA